MTNAQNIDIARRLEDVADLLEAQAANAFRVQAYRRAAVGVRHLTKPLAEVFREQGEQGLRAVTGVGESLARTLRILITTGRLPMLDRLRGETDPIELLESVPGIGKKKLNGIIDTLASRLGRVRRAEHYDKSNQPTVEELLDVDREYRNKADAGALPKIAPRRFNPQGAAWLPILHTHRGARHYTALYSNTARAHQLARTGDWVVLYYDLSDDLYYDGMQDEGQATVITSRHGILSGKRIVRGREDECEHFYSGRGSIGEPMAQVSP